MHSAQPSSRSVRLPETRPQDGDPEGWPLVERVLLALADDAGMTLTLETRLLEVARGLSYRQIADLHDISLNTVKTQVNSVLGSMGVSCCHEIRDASTAAGSRAQAGDSRDEVARFLRLRFE